MSVYVSSLAGLISCVFVSIMSVTVSCQPTTNGRHPIYISLLVASEPEMCLDETCEACLWSLARMCTAASPTALFSDV